MRYGLPGCAAAVLSVTLAVPATAHHEITAKFDPDQSVTLSGVVTKLDWLNPHVHVFMDVAEGPQIINWAIELESPIDLEGAGWDRESLKPGDEITVEGFTARDGSRQAWGESVMVRETGRAVFDTLGPPPASGAADRPAPLWPDGQPRLGPAPGESGYWANPGLTSLVETGVEVEFDEHGLLADIGDAPRVAPFQPWALALY